MTGHGRPSPAQTTLRLEPEVTLLNSTSSLGERFADWVATAADIDLDLLIGNWAVI